MNGRNQLKSFKNRYRNLLRVIINFYPFRWYRRLWFRKKMVKHTIKELKTLCFPSIFEVLVYVKWAIKGISTIFRNFSVTIGFNNFHSSSSPSSPSRAREKFVISFIGKMTWSKDLNGRTCGFPNIS